jgi:hypothetical protein
VIETLLELIGAAAPGNRRLSLIVGAVFTSITIALVAVALLT